MKRQLIHSLISLFLPAAAVAQIYTPLPSDYDYSAVNSHFSSCLNGQVNGMYTPSEFENEHIFSLSQLSGVSARVWDEWRSANSAFSEYKLRSKLYSLGLFVDRMPVNETPASEMTFTFGYKGTTTPPYPVFFLLHGSGPVEDEWKAIQAVGKNTSDSPCLYFIPKMPNPSGMKYRWYLKSKQAVWEAMIRQLFLRSDVDINKIYFTGISEGAYGSQRLGAFYADYLAGVGPMAGGEPFENAPCENMRHIAFSLTTGSNDANYFRNVLTPLADEKLNALAEKYPGDYIHNVVIPQGAGHADISYYNTTPWLRDYSRRANPKHICWEDFAMDGRYRDAFYNIKVVKRNNSDKFMVRDYYEMDIDDNNHIDIRVSTLTLTPSRYDVSYGTTINIDYDRDYAPSTSGSFKVYLGNDLVDLSKEVVLTVNGKEIFRGVVQPTLADLVNSCADFYDPARLYPASILVDLSTMTGSALTSAIEDISVDENADVLTGVSYYNLQGIKINNPMAAPGIYIRRTATSASLVQFN